jgi:hypothetical protein
MAIQNYKPYLWMKAQPEAGSILYGVVQLDAFETLELLPDDPDDENGTLTITYIVLSEGGERYPHDEFFTRTLSEPNYENVIVRIDGGSATKQGTGTGHQSEGDSSDGD